MKNILFAILAILIYTSGFNQQLQPVKQLKKQDYLKKSKAQKRAAWIIFIAGGALFIAGVGWDKGEHLEFSGWDFDSEINNEDKSTNYPLVIAGSLSMLGSIPFFIKSGNNNKKATNATFNLKIEKSTVLHQNRISNNHYPTFSFKIRFL